jgi:hypothetical protein
MFSGLMHGASLAEAFAGLEDEAAQEAFERLISLQVIGDICV